MLWTLAKACGFECRIGALLGGSVWEPVAEELEFVDSLLPLTGLKGFRPDVVVCCKPLPGVVTLAEQIAEDSGSKLVFDIDDPDFEATFGQGRAEQAFRFFYRSVLGRNPRSWFAARSSVRFGIKLLSNPTLSTLYGNGTVVPHAKPDAGTHPQISEGSSPLTIAFLGTPRPHKGIEVLRSVARDLGFSLIVSAARPDRTSRNEQWVGRTNLKDSLTLLASADVVALPSTSGAMASFQLPMKLIDAMNLGKCIVASRLAPIEWALGEAGLYVRPGNKTDLSNSLQQALDLKVRREKGSSARSRFLDYFSLDVVKQQFGETIEGLTDEGR